MERHRLNPQSLLLTLFMGTAALGVQATTDTTRTDTVSAVVVYGDELLLEADEALSDDRLDRKSVV